MTTRRPCAQVLRVTLVDTPGYGDKLDSARTPARAVHLIFNHALRCLRRKLAGEQSVRGSDPLDAKARNASDEHTMRMALIANVSTPVQAHPDEQLHCLLYFVPPHRLLSTDRLFLQRMQRLMPVIVVISKADTLSDAELAAQREMLKNELALAHIVPYTFSEDVARSADAPPTAGSSAGSSAADAADAAVAFAAAKEARLPLSCRRYSRGRQPGEALAIASRSAGYPWGKLSAVDPNHSDLLLLQQLLLSHHAEELIHIARARYHSYRRRRVRVDMLQTLLKRLAFVAVSARMIATWEPEQTAALAGAGRAARDRAMSAVGAVSQRVASSGPPTPPAKPEPELQRVGRRWQLPLRPRKQ